jgi:hypothetical protein
MDDPICTVSFNKILAQNSLQVKVLSKETKETIF